MNKSQPGYVLVLALFVIAVGSMLVTSLLQRAVTFHRLHMLLTKQQQARLLALNGLEIARAQLSNPFELEGSTTKDSKALTIDQSLVPFLYTDLLQSFTLSVEKEGVDGEIKLYITCQDGLINLNSLYNFEEKKYALEKDVKSQDVVTLLQDTMQKKFAVENITQTLEQAFKKHDRPFEDVSELVSYGIGGNLFLSLDELDRKKDEPANIPEALTDIFTVASTTKQMQPLYFSESMAHILHLDKQKLDKKQRLEIIKKIISLKSPIDWAKQWKELLAGLYKKEYTVLPDVIKKSIAAKIEVTAFFVISYGKVPGIGSQDIVQKVGAYLEKTISPETKLVSYAIKRLYWL